MNLSDARQSIVRWTCGLLMGPMLSAFPSSYASTEGWLLLGEPGEDLQYYYDPLNVKQVSPGLTSVDYLINYVNNAGEPQSLLGSTVYDCERSSKQEQAMTHHKLHWASGRVIGKADGEKEWTDVKRQSNGMKLLKIVCR